MSAQGLPAHILALFTPRPPPQQLPPMPIKRGIKITGCAEFVEFLPKEVPPPREAWESPLERKQRKLREKMEKHKEEQKKIIAVYEPHKDPNAVGDPWKTLFVARISYDTTEKKLKREFEVFGSIKRVRMVYDQKGKPRGYAFIEYEHERDLKNAYKQGDGKKIDGRRVMVDVERGRTVEGWLPRRLGGGRGPGRVGKPSKKKLKKMAALEAAAGGKKPTDEKESKDGKEKDPKERDQRGEKDRDRGEKEHREKDRGDKDKEREKDHRGDNKDKEREKDHRAEKKDDNRENDKEREKDREKDRAKDKEKAKDKAKDDKERGGGGRDKEKEREKDRAKDRDRERDHRGGEKDKDKQASRGGEKEKDNGKDRHRDDKDRDRREKDDHHRGGEKDRGGKDHREKDRDNRKRDRSQDRGGDREKERKAKRARD